MPFRTLDQAGDLQGMRALVRVDFNTPVENGRVSDDTRLRAALPTIRFLSERGARVVLVAHFGRPKGQRRDDMSLRVVAEPLSALLEQPVAFGDDCVGATAKAIVEALGPGGVALLENLRFHAGEEANDAAFAAELAALGDLYVDDAFSAAHRAHASVEAITHLLPSYAGLAMTQELEALDRALGAPVRPVMGIVGGSKVSSKIDLLENLVGRLDQLAIGGGMANTFLAAQGREVGDSLYEPDLLPTARTIMQAAEAAGCVLLLPMDVVCATALEEGAGATVRGLDAVGQGEKIFDAGPQSVQRLRSAMDASATVIWNGPLGVFEVPPFDAATTAAARHAAERCRAGKLVAVAGGGDTVAALNHAGVAGEFTFVSTAGGAFLEWMEGKTLPGVAALERAGG